MWNENCMTGENNTADYALVGGDVRSRTHCLHSKRMLQGLSSWFHTERNMTKGSRMEPPVGLKVASSVLWKLS